MRTLTVTALLLGPLALTPAAAAEPESREWQASASLSLWRPALQDDLTLPGGPAIKFEDPNLDEAELAPLLEARFWNEKWAIDVGGFLFEADSSSQSAAGFQLGAVAVASGAAYSAEADYGAFWAILSRCVAEEPLEGPEETRGLLRLDLGAGVRVSDMSVEIASGASRDVGDALWVEALAVARLGVDLPAGVDFDIHGEIGGGADSSTWGIGTRLTWSPEPWWGAHVGYRFISTDLDDDGFEYEGALAGLYAGLTISF
jgi:hypothetical protein